MFGAVFCRWFEFDRYIKISYSVAWWGKVGESACFSRN